MAGAGRKWMVGCGIGCGLMVIILGGAGTCAYFSFKEITKQAEGLDESFDAVESRFGDPTDFTPNGDGTIDSDRMEVFLAIRDDMTPSRDEISGMLSVLDGGGNWIAKAKAGMKLIPAMIRFIDIRNETLLEHGMGVGEYQYIYALSYFVLLNKDPADGPGFVLAGDEDEDDDDAVRLNWGVADDDDDVKEARGRRVRSFINDLQIVVLENQIAAYQASLPAGTALSSDPWGARMLAEMEAMRLETLRIPWEEDLPEQTRASLEPYRDRLDAAYDPLTSVIEMGLTDED